MKLLLFLLSLLPLTLKATPHNPAPSAIIVVTDSLVGRYDGALTRVHMNEDKAPIAGVSSVVSELSDGLLRIQIPPFKVGSMPGAVTVDARGIKVGQDGKFGQKCKDIVKIKIMGLPMSYDGEIVGRFDGGRLIYTVTVRGKIAFKSFVNITTFEGQRP